jgi:hypothetical protein
LIDYLKDKRILAGIIAVLLVASVVTGIFPAFRQYSVVVNPQAQWVLFQGDQLKDPNDGVANIKNTIKTDFQAQDWEIIKTVEVGKRSNARDGWNKFRGEYRSNPALVVIGGDQTPLYGDGAYYWGGWLHSESNQAGTINLQTSLVYGTEGKSWNNDDVALVKFVMDGTRPVILIWTGDRFDTGNLRDIRAAWQWVAAYGQNHQHNWYIFNESGILIDHEITAAPPPPSTPPPPGGEDEPPVADITPPDVLVVFPSRYAEVKETVTIRIEATDSESGVAKIEVYVNDKLLGTPIPTETPNIYEIKWDTTTEENGNANIVVMADDYAGNSVQTNRWVVVANPVPEGPPPPPPTTEERVGMFLSKYKWYIAGFMVFIIIIVLAIMGFNIVMLILKKFL